MLCKSGFRRSVELWRRRRLLFLSLSLLSVVPAATTFSLRQCNTGERLSRAQREQNRGDCRAISHFLSLSLSLFDKKVHPAFVGKSEGGAISACTRLLLLTYICTCYCASVVFLLLCDSASGRRETNRGDRERSVERKCPRTIGSRVVYSSLSLSLSASLSFSAFSMCTSAFG